MQRAIELALKGTRNAYPNPSVGAVIVHEDRIIGEGFTSAYGGTHAEPNAIRSVKDESLLKESTMYVTLEPCAHYGKTPPCSLLIAEKQIKKVVIGSVDPHSVVAGKGVEILKNAGVEIEILNLPETNELHKRFFTFQTKKRPFVILKWAETLDGLMDRERKDDTTKINWISNALSKQQVHQLRATEHAILVGTQTAINDNPSLTTREVGGKNPIRILIDKDLKTPYNYHFFDGSTETLVFTENEMFPTKNTEFILIDFSKDIVPQILEKLFERNIQSLIVEGGKQTLESFIKADLWDEAFVFTGNTKFEKGLEAPRLNGKASESFDFGKDKLNIYNNN